MTTPALARSLMYESAAKNARALGRRDRARRGCVRSPGADQRAKRRGRRRRARGPAGHGGRPARRRRRAAGWQRAVRRPDPRPLAPRQPNVALSPASISQALAMAFAGARGATASQIAGALDFRLPPARLGAAFDAADRSLGERQRARRDARHRQRPVRPDRSALPPGVSARARARLRRRPADRGLRCAMPPAPGREINAWVSGQTQGKIPALLGPGDVDPTTKLVLVNAVYLKAKWLEPFAHEDTSPARSMRPPARSRSRRCIRPGRSATSGPRAIRRSSCATGRAAGVRHPAAGPRPARVRCCRASPARDRSRCSLDCARRRSRSRCRSSG